jgi:hypothetical protein
MKIASILFFMAFSMFCFGQNAEVSEKNIKKNIYFLSSDKMKGRQTGSKQIEKTARFIEKQFKKMGLQPLGNIGFRQHFTAKVKRVVVSDSLRKASNIIGFLDNGAEKTIVIGAHYDHIGFGELGNSKDDKSNIETSKRISGFSVMYLQNNKIEL